MLRQRDDGLIYYRFASLACHDEVVHGVFTRLGGVSCPPFASLNVDDSVGDVLEAVAANRDRICRVLGIARGAIVTAHQVHGDHVATVGPEDRGQTMAMTDALLTNVPGVALMLRFADCVPLALYDPYRHVVALAHAGWKGTVGGIARRTVWAMGEVYGSRPADIVAGIGPAIGPCCYQIGENVAQRVRGAFALGSLPLQQRVDGSLFFDLWEANRRQLATLGIKQIESATLCTACHNDEFFSHRADGGRTGRFGVVIGIRD